VEDLAGRLGVEAALVSVVQVHSDEFPAGDLGCPSAKGALADRPGFVMEQGIVLSVGGQRCLYHARGGRVVFCGKR
jgi:hypothetical protein